MNDFYQQTDLFDISGCKRKSVLENWLKHNHIPYLSNAKGQLVAHKKAVAEQFGVSSDSKETQSTVKLNFTRPHGTSEATPKQ